MTADQLRIDGLTLEAGPRHRPRRLVDGAGLTLARGRVLALVGASGGGKSLTAQAILGLLPPGVRQVSGTLAADGTALGTAEIARLRGQTIGYVPQAPRGGLNPLVTLGRHFSETLACDGIAGARGAAEAERLLAAVGFGDPGAVRRLYPSQLSGGMLQRAAIALALCRDPDFLVADEPTTDLDLLVQASLLDLLDRLVATCRLGLLLVTHDLSVAARLADAVAVMHEGRIVEQQTVHRLFDRPQHPQTRALLTAHRALYPPPAATAPLCMAAL